MSYTPELEIHQDIPLKQKLLKKWFWLYFFAFLIAPTGYIIKLIAARTMSVEDIGLFYSILGLIGIVASYNDLGLTESLQYFLPKYLIAKDYVKAKTLLITTWLIQIVSGMIIWSALWFGAPRLAEHYFQSSQAIIVLRIFCGYFLLINLFQVMQSLFLAAQDTKTSNGIDAARMWTWMIALIAFWQFGMVTIITMTYVWIIGIMVGILVAGIIFWRRFGWLMIRYHSDHNRWWFRERIGYAWWVFLWANTNALLWQLDLQFALYFLGKEAAWHWTVYLSLLTAVNLVNAPLVGYLFPLVNELVTKNQHDKLHLLMRYIGWWLWWLAIVVWIGSYYLWPWLAQLLFGSEFGISWELLAFAAPFVMFGPAVWFGFQYLAGTGKAKQRVGILFIWLIANIITNVLLIPSMWLRGLVIGMVVSYLVMGLGVVWVVKR